MNASLTQYAIGAVAALIVGLYAAYRVALGRAERAETKTKILETDKEVAKTEQRVDSAKEKAAVSLEKYRRSRDRYKNSRGFFGLKYGVDDEGGDGPDDGLK